MTSIKLSNNSVNITLNSLVLDFCDYFSKNKNIVDHREILSITEFNNFLLSKEKTNFLNNKVYDFFLDFIDTKIFLGERVIIEKLKFLNEEKIKNLLIKLYNRKINIYSIINNNVNKKIVNLIKNYSTIVDENLDKINVCKKIDFNDKLINEKYLGITVIGDVHGQKEKLLNAVEWAKKNENLIIFLGDIINYGPHSIECVEIVYDLLIRNKAVFIIGNHERKLFKVLNGDGVFLNEASEKTIEKISNMKDNEKHSWIIKFNTIMNLGRIFFKYKNMFFCHGGFSNLLLKYNNDLEIDNKLKNICIFGDKNIFKEKKYIKKSFSEILKNKWIENIPPNIFVFLGHNMVEDNYPYVYNHSNGSKIYLLDTGAGKGGFLTSADIKISDNIVEFKNFNIW